MSQQQGKIWITFDSKTQQRSQPMSQKEMQMGLLTLRVKDLEHLYIWTPGWENWQPLKIFLSSDQKYFIGVGTSPKVHEIDLDSVPSFDPNEITQVIKGTNQKKKPHTEITEDEANAKTVTSPLAKLKRQRGDMGKKSTPSTHVEKSNVKKEFTKLVDPNEFSIDEKEEIGKKDLSGDDILSAKVLEKVSAEHLSFELRPEDRTYAKRSERHGFKIEVLLMFPNHQILKSFSRDISLTGTLIEDNIPTEHLQKNIDIVLVNRLSKDVSKSKIILKCKAVGGTVTRRLVFVNMNDKKLDELETLLKAYLELQEELQKQAG